jgi:Polyketide cyclase / dehydrase and lipid transport
MQKQYNYSFVTIWKISASVDQVWNIIYEQEQWPNWWRGVKKVETLLPGDINNIGKKMRYTWKSFLPYTLSFDMVSKFIIKNYLMEGQAFGELEGVGIWKFTEENGITTIQYNWDVNATKPWMQKLAPVLKPLFIWNHNVIMRWGAEGLAKKLNAHLLQY